MKNNQELVDYLKKEGWPKELMRVFLKIDRKDFVRPENCEEAYGDYPLPIGFGQTISQPSTVAFMLNLLAPQKGHSVLDIGSGSGWTMALLAEIVGPKGRVLGLEIIPELVEFGKENLAKYNFAWARIEAADPVKLGRPREVFDRILVSAAAEKLPAELIAQLKPDGHLVIPIDNTIYKVNYLSGSKIAYRAFPGFVFVPLQINS